MQLSLLFYMVVVLFLAVAYFFILFRYAKAWHQTPIFKPLSNYIPHTRITVLIVARNEEIAIPHLLTALQNQTYPKHLWEAIFIDDNSTDNTPNLISQHKNPFKLLKLSDFPTNESNSFKKKAIEIGINQAKGTLIVTTDADCRMPPEWLATIAEFYEKTPTKMIAAPVVFEQEKNILGAFQTLDFMGMMAITAAGIQTNQMRMANGANLAYEKTAFQDVGGFKGINNIASGDDMLLMHKIAAKFPTSISFLKAKQAIVKTTPKDTWKEFKEQRVRWGTKSAGYQEKQVTLILALVWFFCLSFWLTTLFTLFFPPLIYLFFLQIFLKFIADCLLLIPPTLYFQRRDLLAPLPFITAFFIHIFYISYIGFLSNWRKEYEWKGRRVH